MNDIPESALTQGTRLHESEAFPELVSATSRWIEHGDALEAYRAFDDGVFAAVPHALEAYISHQQFKLN